MQSNKNSLSREDVGKWLKNTMIFSAPALLAFLVALQGGSDMQFALGAGYSALIGATIDLIKKYQAGEVK